jgi:energy-coupling factor transport system permease protein
MGLSLAVLIVAVNALVVSRGETVLARLGEWPLLGQVDVTAEAIAAGAVIGLRAAVAMVAFAVYSACVDPDRVLRALRPIAGRSALTATLVSRLVPVAAADASRLRDAARLRGPGAAPVGKAPLARRLLAGSLDRAVDVAATLELRGYSLPGRPPSRCNANVTYLLSYALHRFVSRFAKPRCNAFDSRYMSYALHRRFASRYDGRFYAVGATVLVAAIAGKLLGADDFNAYPMIAIGTSPSTLALAALVTLSGFAPLRRRPSRRAVLKTTPPTQQSLEPSSA